jgi:hypothetical protein
MAWTASRRVPFKNGHDGCLVVVGIVVAGIVIHVLFVFFFRLFRHAV